MTAIPSENRASRQFGDSRPPHQVSFEFFPPKTDAMEERFWDSVHKLAPLNPRFVSVTYGAGGSTRERTLRMVSQVKSTTGVDAAAHLTCVGASRDEVDAVVRGYKEAGITRIVALRGDPAEGIGQPFVPHPEGYTSAADLVAGITRIGDFDISVAAYPDKHPQSPDWDTEIANLKRKFDAGATRAITQMFFDNGDYFRLLDRAQKAGITQPIVPGIQPIHSFKQISSFAAKNGAKVPRWLAERFDGLDEDPETHALVASAVAAEQVLELVDEGITEFHFFTLNRSNFVLALARLLGVRPD
ncbi:MAG: methylenetetrahydrofolate reductase [NAD(P)H] [Hyphomicrobiales bacterium]|nr:MAG: methylenetetrahydrofolate reductase [NAD(P)H] [Hyphomicrobiales bacterium]